MEVKKRVADDYKMIVDTICFNRNLMEKYKWLIDEFSKVDFDIHLKKGEFHDVVLEQMKIQDLLFKIEMQRWLGLYSEIDGNIDVDMVNEHIKRLGLLLNDQNQQDYQKHLPSYKLDELRKDLDSAKIKMKVEAKKVKGLVKASSLMSKVNMINKKKSEVNVMKKVKENLKTKVFDE